MLGKEYNVIGLMSGTSGDGLDMAYCKFNYNGKHWNFVIDQAITFDYPEYLLDSMRIADTLSASDFLKLHNTVGIFFGNQVNRFIRDNKLSVHFIASHGHTVFHQPNERLNFQIGNPQIIRQITGLPVVADFRTQNILNGGQGAPLVPIGDKLLFHQYHYCINIGGFSNISYENNKKQRIAFDICPVNIVLNMLAKSKHKTFDKNGEIGKKGKIYLPLLKELNKLTYYQQSPPKSLGKEWITAFFLPILNYYNIPIEDKMRTIYEHIVIQFQNVLNNLPVGTILLTGGGTHNHFLVELLQKNINHKIIIPEKKIIDYKEALIFAFLGVLRMENITNCLSSYTGSNSDMVCGVIF
ncbi:MAG TPA: anhydro-N-acetylmuramic acid kinase [Bacteroidales bacterium]|nr:anhydro-N-acetylmuramic acid kinase [Bacteroidales bacterium]